MNIFLHTKCKIEQIDDLKHKNVNAKQHCSLFCKTCLKSAGHFSNHLNTSCIQLSHRKQLVKFFEGIFRVEVAIFSFLLTLLLLLLLLSLSQHTLTLTLSYYGISWETLTNSLSLSHFPLIISISHLLRACTLPSPLSLYFTH